MPVETVTLQIPEIIYQRLVNTARATGRSLEEVILQAIKVGSPPTWDDVPEEFQADIAALDKLDDNALWQILHSRKTASDMERYNILLERNSNGTLTEAERLELIALRHEADLFMLRKAQASVLLRWRGHIVPTP
jgi:paraquat-inducible protein B